MTTGFDQANSEFGSFQLAEEQVYIILQNKSNKNKQNKTKQNKTKQNKIK